MDKKGNDVALLDVSDLLMVTDVFVIGSGTSNRHVRPLAHDVEGLLDYGDFVVHLFDTETREFYDLERLWADAPRLEFSGMSANTEV